MRRGAALPAVLLALTMTSALVVGGAFVSRSLVASARHTIRGTELRPAAEMALVAAIAAWDSVARTAQPIGVTEQLPTVAFPGEQTSLWITRTSDRVFWLAAESRSATPPVLHRRIGAVVAWDGVAPTVVHPRGWGELP